MIKRKTITQKFDMVNRTESSEYLRSSEILQNHNFPVTYHNVCCRPEIISTSISGK